MQLTAALPIRLSRLNEPKSSPGSSSSPLLNSCRSYSCLPNFGGKIIPHKQNQNPLPVIPQISSLHPLQSPMVLLQKPSSRSKPPSKPPPTPSPSDHLITILADSGCTLQTPTNTPSLPPDLHKFKQSLHTLFTTSPSSLSQFLTGFTSFTNSPKNLQIFLTNISSNTSSASQNQTLLRILLLIPSLQYKLQCILLEKLPELFSSSNVCQQIVNQLRYIDFLVDSRGFVEKLLEVLSVCPVELKKEVIGSLPEIIGGDEKNNENVVESLRQMLEEDKEELIVPVLDSFSNLHLSEVLQEQVVTIALSFVRTIDAQHMPYLLRFLLMSANHANGRRIVSQIRQQLRFVGGVDNRSGLARAKGKSVVDNFESLILEALRSSLQFKNVLSQEILNELKSIDKAEDHRVIDVWLLMLIYMNGGTSQKSVEKMIKKKIMDDCLGIALFDQCIHGHRELVQGHFSSFLSLCEYLLACKEQKAREFSNHLYISLFNEFTDTYSRHEILGGLVTHIGSGVAYEVGSALDTMVLLATKYSQELIPFFSYINGILDYIEGFNDENLHKVYEVFSYLALSGRLNSDSVCSSIANELLIIVRKQVSNPDLKYKKMGLIGTLKIVSRLGDEKIATQFSTPQRTDCEESLELLRMALDSCKSFPLPLIMFYDELIALLERTSLQPVLMEWIGKHAGDFESIFLSDLEGGQLLSKGSFCGLEGELWMNLDGDLSPICLNILPLVSSSLQCSSSLQILPAYFLLLSVVERVTNQGSLGGIDALLGCPLWLPSHKYFGETVWSSLTAKQRQAMCLSLYYASNWIRELLNAFCTQVIGEVDRTSQATRDELISKLSKRLRNLVLLESLLDTSLKLHPLSLPELHLLAENSGSSSGKPNFSMNMEKKNEKSTISQSNSSNKKLKRKISSQSANDKLKQPTILEMLKRAGVSQEVPSDGLPDHLGKNRESQHEETPPSTSTCSIEISAATRVLDGQRFKCRSLSVDTLFLLTFSTDQDMCCADPRAELPLHLYLLRDLCHKLDCLTPQTKQTPAGSLRTPFDNRLIVNEFIYKLGKLLPYLRKYFDCAVSFLNGGDDTCGGHWNTESVAAGNPDIPGLVVSNTVVAGLVFKEVLSCLCKMLNLPNVRMNVPVLTDLLKAFQPINISDSFLSAIQPIPSPGNMDYLYCGAYAFFEGVLDTACSSSVMMASEVLVTLESIVNSAKYFLDKLLEGSGKNMHIGFVQKVIPILRNRLGTCAHKLLTRNWDSETIDNSCKIKGETIQKMVHIYFENSESTADLLEEFVCSVLTQAPSSKTQPTAQDAIHGFPTLCPTTFLVWYRASYEENHSILSKQVKEVSVLEKSRSSVNADSVKKLLKKLHQSVNVVVSLVNMCKTHDKVAVHAMAVKYGGKFVDTFLKVFDFLQAHFGEHSDVIVLLIKELQKATRTIQTLCSEAKGCKRTMITSKIPATKRSMERFLFGVKALLYSTSNGGNFWMGNLKHKDLYGQVVSSQVYPGGDGSDEGEGNDPMDQDVEEVVSIASQHDDDEEEEAEPSDE